jgi:hypothetical protein
MHANLPVLAHQANNPLAAAVHAEPGTLGMHTRHAVGAAGPLIIAVIAWLSCAPALCRAEGGPAGEGAEPRAGDPEDPAEPLDAIGVTVIGDESEAADRIVSWAK